MNLINSVFFPLACWLLFSAISTITVQAQSLNYDVFRGDSHIGEMVVHQKMENGNKVFVSESNIQLSFLMTLDLKFTYEAHFRDKKLCRSQVQNIRNGKLINTSNGRRVGHSYVTEVNGELKTLKPAEIDYCILSAYFEEPGGRHNVFSERWGEYIKVARTSLHSYSHTLPNGNTNYLTYEGGICREIQINHVLGTLYFRLKKS